MEDDDSSSLEKSEELVANQPRQKASHGKRRKHSDEDSDADSRPASSTSYDEDEAALKQALALSLASTPVEEGKFLRLLSPPLLSFVSLPSGIGDVQARKATRNLHASRSLQDQLV